MAESTHYEQTVGQKGEGGILTAPKLISGDKLTANPNTQYPIQNANSSIPDQRLVR